MTSLNFISMKVLSSDIVTLGIRVSTYEFGVGEYN